MQIRSVALGWLLILGVSGLPASGQQDVEQDPAGQDPEAATKQAAIEDAIGAYVTAFNGGDVDRLAELWSPAAVYTNRTTGEQSFGREAIKAELDAIFAEEPYPQLAVATESIEFISPSVALERGTATVTRGEDQVAETAYKVVYVLQDGQWLIDRISEDEVVAATTHYEQLQELQWLIGEWSHEADGTTIEIVCRWTKNQNYISRTYAVSTEGVVESSGLQIIGWDPQQQQIRSWLFDSEGGFVSGTWTQREDKWIVQATATLADGGSGSFTSIMRPLDEDTYAWERINRVVDAELLPNEAEIVMQRKPADLPE